MLDEFVNVLKYLVQFIALQGLNQKPTIAAEEKERAATPAAIACRELQSFLVRGAK